MPDCTVESIELGKVGRRLIEASFDGGGLTSDAGALLVRRADEKIGLTRAAAAVFADERRAASVTHPIHSLLALRPSSRDPASTAGAPVATNSRATSCACCWPHWPTRS